SPWYLALIIRDPDFAYQFFIDHHITRFFGTKYHEEAFWFYIPVVLVACLPWSLLFPSFASFLLSRRPAPGSVRSKALGFLVLWSTWSVLFFSLSRCKLPPYILPAIPPIALSLGYFLDCVLFRRELTDYPSIVRGTVPQIMLAGMAATWLFLHGWA